LPGPANASSFTSYKITATESGSSTGKVSGDSRIVQVYALHAIDLIEIQVASNVDPPCVDVLRLTSCEADRFSNAVPENNVTESFALSLRNKLTILKPKLRMKRSPFQVQRHEARAVPNDGCPIHLQPPWMDGHPLDHFEGIGDASQQVSNDK
jgi:hypothetical protein